MAHVADPLTRFTEGSLDFLGLLNAIQRNPNPSNKLAETITEILFKPQDRFGDATKDSVMTALQAIHENNLITAVALRALPVQPAVPAPVSEQPRPLHLSALLTELFATTKEAVTEDACKTLQQASCKENEPLTLVLKQKTPHVASSLQHAQSALKKQITSLTIECSAFTQEELVGIISACPHLTTLSLCSLHACTDLVAEQATWPKKLVHLSVEATSLTAKGLEAIFKKCGLLQCVDIRACSKMSLVDVSKLTPPKTLVNLRHDAFWKQQNEKSLTECPQDSLIRAIALTEAVGQQGSEALKSLVAYRKNHPTDIPAAVALADLYRTGAIAVSRSLQTAQELIEPLLKQFPNEPLLTACKARLQFDSGLHDEAYKLADDAYKALPNDPFVLATYAEMKRCRGDLVSAKAAADRALAYNPHNVYAMTCKAALDEAQAMALCKKALSINYHNERALVLQSRLCDAEEAKKLLDEALKVNPDSWPAHSALAKLALKDKDPQMALFHYQEALRIAPTNVELLTKYAELISVGRKGIDMDIPLAIALLTRAIEIDRFNYSALTALASILMDEIAGDKQDAAYSQQLAERAYPQNPEDPFLQWILGDLYIRNDGKCTFDPTKGLPLLEKVVTGKEYGLNAKLSLARYYTFSDTARAKAYLKEALQDDPEYIVTLTSLAALYIMEQDVAKAQAHVTKALEKDPKSPQALFLQAKIHLQNKDLAQASTAVNTLLSMKLGEEIRKGLVVLLSEHPALLADGRKEALKILEV